MPVVSATPIQPQLGMKRPLVVVPPVPAAPPVEAVKPGAAQAPTEFERKFVVQETALAKVQTIQGVERRMVYDTYIEPEVADLPPLRFRFETSVDPALGNSERGECVIAYADFTTKTGDDASKRTETIYPLVFHCPNPLAAINAFSTIYGARVQSERYRWSGREGKFQLVIYAGAAVENVGGRRMVIELEAADEETLTLFAPPASWREVTHDKRYSNYSIAACGWPE